jgi:hypothetical protein
MPSLVALLRLIKKESQRVLRPIYRQVGKDLPSAVKCLDTSIDACLTFFNFLKDGATLAIKPHRKSA